MRSFLRRPSSSYSLAFRTGSFVDILLFFKFVYIKKSNYTYYLILVIF